MSEGGRDVRLCSCRSRLATGRSGVPVVGSRYAGCVLCSGWSAARREVLVLALFGQQDALALVPTVYSGCTNYTTRCILQVVRYTLFCSHHASFHRELEVEKQYKLTFLTTTHRCQFLYFWGSHRPPNNFNF